MCNRCDLLAAGEIDYVTADVCDEAELGIPRVPDFDFEEQL